MPITGQALETALAGTQDPSAVIQVMTDNGPLVANHHRPDNAAVRNDQVVSDPALDPNKLDLM